MSSTNSNLFFYPKLSDDQIAEYHQRGFLNVGRTLTDEGLRSIRDEVMEAWRKEKGEFKEGGTWLENALLIDIHHRSLVVRNYYFSGPLLDIAEQLIGPNVKAATSQLT